MYFIVYSFKQWYIHLMDAPNIIVFTDNVTAKYFSEQPRLSPKQMRWQEFLQKFPQTEIIYKPGKENVVADALSRREIWLSGAWQVQSQWPEEILKAYKNDTLAKSWLVKIAKSEKVPHIHVDRAGMIKWKQAKMYVPESLRLRMLNMFHDSAWAGHVGQRATYALLKKQCYWPDMKEEVVNYVQSCIICQRNRPEYKKMAGLLQPLPIPSAPWESISMDFIMGLPKSRSYDSILVVVDQFSKMASFIPTHEKVSANQVAELLFANVFKNWGMPLDMLSDRDPKFVAKFWRSLFDIMGAQLLRSSAYHSHTDGQTERVNLVLEEYLRGYVKPDQTNWSELLYMAEFRYNSQVHSATGFSPFFLATGRHPRLPTWFENPDPASIRSPIPAVEEFLKERVLVYGEATASITRAQRRYKEQSDARRREVVYQVGKLAWLHLLPHQLHRKLSPKLAQRYVGPYRILDKAHKDNKVSYVLDLPRTMQIVPIFHVNRLKKFVQGEDSNRVQVLKPDPVVIEEEFEYEVEGILSHRIKKNKGRTSMEYLVMWKGFDPCENTWEPEWHLKNAQEILHSYRKKEGLA